MHNVAMNGDHVRRWYHGLMEDGSALESSYLFSRKYTYKDSDLAGKNTFC